MPGRRSSKKPLPNWTAKKIQLTNRGNVSEVRSHPRFGRRSSRTSTSSVKLDGPFPTLGSARDSVNLFQKKRSLANWTPGRSSGGSTSTGHSGPKGRNSTTPYYAVLRRYFSANSARTLCVDKCPRQHGAFDAHSSTAQAVDKHPRCSRALWRPSSPHGQTLVAARGNPAARSDHQ